MKPAETIEPVQMDAHIKATIREIGGESVLFDVPMSEYTTFQTGGNVQAMYRAGKLEELRNMVTFLGGEGIAYFIIGRGSNLLVRDGGFDGVAIMLNGSLASIEAISGVAVRGGAGLTVRTLVDFCTEKGLAGVEFLAGIPGTLGGAVVMNAGSWGKEIGDIVREITVLTMGGTVERREGKNLSFKYRGLDLSTGDIIVGANLSLSFDESAAIRGRVGSYVKRRKRQFPLDMPSAGSVFRNPEGDSAGRLIEAAGLKGTVIGGAMISPRHANFIVNRGNSSASDIVALMDLARIKVNEMFNIQLVPEVKMVGEE